MRLISKLHADADSKPLFLAPLEGQVSDYKDAVPLLNSLPRAKEILAGYGADENWLHGTLISRGMYSAKKIETSLFYYDKNIYKYRNELEIMFGRIKVWCRIAMRYDSCAHDLLFGTSAIYFPKACKVSNISLY